MERPAEYLAIPTLTPRPITSDDIRDRQYYRAFHHNKALQAKLEKDILAEAKRIGFGVAESLDASYAHGRIVDEYAEPAPGPPNREPGH